MEIQLIEHIKPPAATPFIQQAFWIQPNAIEIHWIVSPLILPSLRNKITQYLYTFLLFLFCKLKLTAETSKSFNGCNYTL